ncbi:hypothetical protein Agub_g13899, partial [Astrephomene gubernaculifera]
MTMLGMPDMAEPKELGKSCHLSQPDLAKTMEVFRVVLEGYDLYVKDRLAFRKVSKAARDLHDQLASDVSFNTNRYLRGSSDIPSVSTSEIVAAVRGFLSRGCRPTHLSIEMPEEQDTALHDGKLLALLFMWREAASVTDLRLETGYPLTPAVVSAIAGLSPKLNSIVLLCGRSSPDGTNQPAEPVDLDGAAAAAEELLRQLGPRLRRLEFRMLDGCRYVWPTRAFRGLSHCTALRELELACFEDLLPHDGVPADLLVLRSIASLSGLKSLQLADTTMRFDPPVPLPTPIERLASTPSLESCLSGLTALTCLKLHLGRLHHYANKEDYEYASYVADTRGLDERLEELRQLGRHAEAATLQAAAAAESHAVAAAIRCMPHLKELRTPAMLHAADLPALTTLTCLRMGSIAVPTELPAAASDFKLVLPSQLQRFELHAPLPVRVAAALQAPPREPGDVPCSLMAGGRLWDFEANHWCLDFRSGDLDDEGRLTAGAVDAMRRAVTAIRGFGFRKLKGFCRDDARERGVRVRGLGVTPALPPAVADGGEGSHCAAWLGELTSLRLEALALQGLVVSPRDMLGLARCMAGITELDLSGCSYAVSSLPLLAGLQQLRQLGMHCGDWLCDDMWSEHHQQAIMAACLSITAPVSAGSGSAGEAGELGARGLLPQLKLLQIGCYEDAMDWIEAAVAPAREEWVRWMPSAR